MGSLITEYLRALLAAGPTLLPSSELWDKDCRSKACDGIMQERRKVINNLSYNASEKDLEVNPLKEKQSALEHYKKSRHVLQLWLKQPDNKENEVKDSQELVEILTETIDALEAEIKEQFKGAAGSSSSGTSASAPAPLGSSTTTIGFGSSSTVFGGATSTATASAATTAAPVVTMLQSKKKRPAGEAAAVNDGAAGASASAENNAAKVNRTM